MRSHGLKTCASFGINLLTSAFGKGHNKFFWLPVVLLFMFCVYRFYSKRADSILAKYKESDIFSMKNILFVLLITLGPFLIGIYFLNHSIKV
jgi:hypothetical protein